MSVLEELLRRRAAIREQELQDVPPELREEHARDLAKRDADTWNEVQADARARIAAREREDADLEAFRHGVRQHLGPHTLRGRVLRFMRRWTGKE